LPNIKVSFQKLNGNADRLVAGRDEISSTLSKMQLQIAALVPAGFTTDTSSGAFADAYSRSTSDVQHTIGGLDDLAGFLRSIAHTLGEVDAQLAARLRR